MPRVVDIDFTGAPPAQGGGGDDYVAPGTYPLRCLILEDGKSSAGKRMIIAKWEVATNDAMGGRKLTDRFVIDPGGSKFPLQRLHALLLAFNLPVSEKAIRIDFDGLTNKGVMGVIEDRIQPEGNGYPERTVSNISAYHPIQKAAPAPAPAAAPVTPTPVAAAPAPAPVAPVEPTPIMAAPAAVAATEVAATSDNLAVIGAEVESIFG